MREDDWDNVRDTDYAPETTANPMRFRPKPPPLGPARNAIAQTPLSRYAFPPQHPDSSDAYYQKLMRVPDCVRRTPLVPISVPTLAVAASTPYSQQQRRCIELASHVPVFNDDLGAGVLWLRAK